MDSDSVVTLEKLQNKLNSIEAKIDQNFKDIGSQLKEHTRALAFISQTLGKTDLAGKSPKNTSASPANADEMIADTRTQYEKIREELYISMSIEMNEENNKSPLGKDIDEFLTRMRLTFLKSRLNIADAEPSKLVHVVTSKFPNVMTNFDRVDVKEKDLIKQINGLFTGNIYQGTYTKDLLKNMYNVLLNWD